MSHLTKKIVDAAKYEGDASRKQRCVVWDDDPRGFGVRISPAGKKTWILLYRSPNSNKQRFITLADYPTVSLANARKMATNELSKIFGGADPADDRRNQRRDSLTINELCDVYLEDYAKRRKKTWKNDEYRIKRVLKAKWGKKKVSSISRSDVSKLHAEYGATSLYEANRILNLISTIFRFAIQNGYVPDGAVNPAANISKFREQPRKRWLENDDEMTRFLDAVNAEENIYYRTFFLVILMTGFRRSELTNLKWSDVDLKDGIAKLATTKSGDPQIRQLSPAVCNLLSELPKLEGNPYLFPGRKPGQPLGDLKNPWARIVERAKLDNFHVHDLRRSFVSMLANAGTPLLVASRLAGHSSTQVTESVYSIIGVEPLKEAAALVSAKIMGVNRTKDKRE